MISHTDFKLRIKKMFLTRPLFNKMLGVCFKLTSINITLPIIWKNFSVIITIQKIKCVYISEKKHTIMKKSNKKMYIQIIKKKKFYLNLDFS